MAKLRSLSASQDRDTKMESLSTTQDRDAEDERWINNTEAEDFQDYEDCIIMLFHVFS